MLWHFVYTKGSSVPSILPTSPKILIAIDGFLSKWSARDQGIGKHTEKEVTEMAIKNLRAPSHYLGNAHFLNL